MNRLNFIRGTCNGHLLEKDCAAKIGWISRFAGHLQQAISNFQLLGIGTGAMANAALFIWLLHHETAATPQEEVI
jgi:hypothetical protein